MIHQLIWQFGDETGFNFEPQTGLLSFTFNEGREVHCPTQAVGTLDTEAGFWAWAWANPSHPEDLRREVADVNAHGEQRGFDRLTQASWQAAAEQAWQMTAMAAKLCERSGPYAMSTGPVQVFVMFREVHLNRFEIGP
jgi:hypothetical protein